MQMRPRGTTAYVVLHSSLPLKMAKERMFVTARAVGLEGTVAGARHVGPKFNPQHTQLKVLRWKGKGWSSVAIG